VRRAVSPVPPAFFLPPRILLFYLPQRLNVARLADVTSESLRHQHALQVLSNVWMTGLKQSSLLVVNIHTTQFCVDMLAGIPVLAAFVLTRGHPD
jgi:hypothetical protein